MSAHRDRFQVQQWVPHANQYEPIPDGDFPAFDAAIDKLNELV